MRGKATETVPQCFDVVTRLLKRWKLFVCESALLIDLRIFCKLGPISRRVRVASLSQWYPVAFHFLLKKGDHQVSKKWKRESQAKIAIGIKQ